MPAPKEINKEEWQRIASVYAKYDGNLRMAAAALGWPIARTTRRYKLGYVSKGFPPIKTMLARDAFSANEIRAERELRAGGHSTLVKQKQRARATEVMSAEQALRVQSLVKAEETRARARADAVKSRAEEATLVLINRRNAIALNAVTAQVLKGATALSGKIQRALEEEAAGGQLTLNQQLHLVRSAASIARFNAEATVMAVKAERLVMGQPIETGPGDGQSDSGSLDEAAQWIRATVKAVEKAQLRGLLSPGDFVPEPETEVVK
jgi:hypothetical protein